MNPTFIIILLVILGCNSHGNQTEKSKVKESSNKTTTLQQKENSKYYTKNDTVLIDTETGSTLKFSKAKFNQIVDEHPELYSEFVYNPDDLYYKYGNNIVSFGSEQGQDTYYILYAYFLKQKNGIEIFAEQRRKLIDIFLHLNTLFSYLQYGGTYFGHQRYRIAAYAEYSVYLYPKSGERFEKTYDITKQKELYIKSLRQLIADESKIDFETLGKDKLERTKYLNSIVNKLDSLITDIFYLRRSQAFHYDNYEYY